MAEKKTEVPEDRCGFELQPDDVGFSGSRSWWVDETEPVCCWRPVWESPDETDRCIWHADVDEKPLEKLITARTESPERLDGAILRNLSEERQKLSFGDCSLLGAIFDKSKLWLIDFTDTDLRWADFTVTFLPGADFTDANLRETDFTDAYLTEADFTDTYLSQADFTDAYLPRADFTDAYLEFSDFTDAYLKLSNFTDTDLKYSDFTGAYLQDSELSDADARAASFHHTTLHDTVFTRTDCREATFTSALLYETVFSDTRINSKTTFFDPMTTFYSSILSRPGCVYEENPLTANQLPEDELTIEHLPKNVPATEYLPEDVQPLEAARWVYRRLETLHEENALSEAAREFHISKEEAERAFYRERGEYGPWGVKTLMWYLTRHGESVKRVLTWWGGVILTAGLLFAGLDGVKDATGTTYAITSPSELGTIAGWQDILMNIYFSVTTFSTIMDGGLAPAGNGTRVVVAVESITGALLVALLVFVLGRRVAR